MRSLNLTLVILASIVLSARSAPPTIDGAWVLSDKWTGFMGIALVIKSNEFRYWFYSDVRGPKEPPYPVTGKVEFDGDTIRLRPDGDARLYDANWHWVVFQGEICLLAGLHVQRYRNGQKLEDDRLLHKLDAFDEKKPVMNSPRKRERAAAPLLQSAVAVVHPRVVRSPLHACGCGTAWIRSEFWFTPASREHGCAR